MLRTFPITYIGNKTPREDTSVCTIKISWHPKEKGGLWLRQRRNSFVYSVDLTVLELKVMVVKLLTT